jgi:hypothetical protein
MSIDTDLDNNFQGDEKIVPIQYFICFVKV